ncbi:MAG TPA: hypothetical protein VGI60_01140 [Chthoniobacterales bacterium]|jgi:hypothetical protein
MSDTGEDRKKCFVLMPFEEALREIYTDVYIPTCREREIDCWRVDEVARPGSITRDIIEGILDSALIIADLTGKNANVFYELGIAHALTNKTIMTSQRREDVPFDIANYRVVLYEHNLTGCRRLAQDLGKAMDELLVALERTNNPCQEVLASRSSGVSRIGEPIARHLNFERLPDLVADFLREHKVYYKEDLTPELFERLANAPGIGKRSLSRLCSPLMSDPFFGSLDFLKDFVLKYKIDTTEWF